MQEEYRKAMVRSIKAEAKRAGEMEKLKRRIEELEKTPEIKRYLELKDILETLEMIPIQVEEKINIAKENVFENGCRDEVCLLLDSYSQGYALMYCLDCGSYIDVEEEKLEQFKREHKVINSEPIKVKNFDYNNLRDYYFRLLMNYPSEEAYRIFTLTYEEMLESRSR